MNFSYLWVCTMLFMHVVNFGLIIGKLGDRKIGEYGVTDLVVTTIFCLLTSLALYLWQ